MRRTRPDCETPLEVLVEEDETRLRDEVGEARPQSFGSSSKLFERIYSTVLVYTLDTFLKNIDYYI